MAYALIGELKRTMHRRFAWGYKKPMYEWERNALEGVINKNIGCMEGLALHYYHGDKTKRRYGTREQILVDTQFDPETDIVRDSQGIWQLVARNDRQRKLRDLLMAYWRGRDEDR